MDGLTRRFGLKKALDEREPLRRAQASFFGLVAANGAGKTTLIRHILGLLRAEAGSSASAAEIPSPIRRAFSGRSATSPKSTDVPSWMSRLGSLMRYIAAFFPTWDPA